MRPLKEDSRDKRRTVADALEVVRQELGGDEIPDAEIRVGPFPLPSGEATAAVVLVCPDLDCCVSLTSFLVVYGALREMFAAPPISKSLASTRPRYAQTGPLC